MRWAVDVALNVPIPKCFRYLLPESIDPKEVTAGYRVLVPFRNKVMNGVTFSGPLQANSGKKLRTIIEFDSSLQVIGPDILKLIGWMIRYYHTAPGDWLKVVLAPGVLKPKPAQYQLTERGIQFLQEKPNVLDAQLLKHMYDPITLDGLQKKTQTAVTSTQVRQWEEGGFLAVQGEAGNAFSLIEVVHAQVDSLKTRSQRQKDLFEVVLKHQSLPIQQLKSQFPGASTIVRQLEKKGALKRSLMPEHKWLTAQSAYVKPHDVILTSEQEHVLAEIDGAVGSGNFKSFLLHGVTGAGKTEVYLRAIQSCLEQGKQALFLVPEIALTPMMRERIMARFGHRLAILHSGMSQKQRLRDWSRVHAGKVDLVLGARSAVFAPLPRLGLIVLDEEHDSSYKNQEQPRYHARQVALVRAQQCQATIVLGSATPSLESWVNAKRDRFGLLSMTQRATKVTLPEIEIVDMREEFRQTRKRPLFSRQLTEILGKTLENGEQAMILLNRRGYHNFLLCRRCGESMQCEHCSITLTYHKNRNLLLCHFCDAQVKLPEQCPSCQAPKRYMHFFGEGTEHVEEGLQKQFPGFVVDRLDRDRAKTLAEAEAILDRFRRGDSQVLIGTQMIAKGHDFPNVTLVGILNADIGLRLPDFRSAEWTFQLLTQVAGRSGRGQKAGSVVVQTYMPEHYCIQTAAKHDYFAFAQKELHYRKHLLYPPFAHLLLCQIQHRNREIAEDEAFAIKDLLKPLRGKISLLGPSKSGVFKAKDVYRFQLLIKSEDRKVIQQAGTMCFRLATDGKLQSRLFIDIDPQQFI